MADKTIIGETKLPDGRVLKYGATDPGTGQRYEQVMNQNYSGAQQATAPMQDVNNTKGTTPADLSIQNAQSKTTTQNTATQPMSLDQIQQQLQQIAQTTANVSSQAGAPLVPQFQQQFPDISKKFQDAHQAAKDSNTPAPTDTTGAKDMFDKFMPEQQTSSAMEDFISKDPYLNVVTQSFQKYMDQSNQRASLVDTYQQMLADSGIQQIDMDLINMKNVIEGTEDDIRTEVTKAGGFATDSQVIALSSARNKQLIKNYNTLLETRNSKERYLNTMMNLTAQDRQEADDRFDKMMNFGFKIAEINQTMKKNAVETLDRVAKTLGWDGVYQAAQGNLQVIAQIERTYGLPQGSLQIAAQRDAEIRAFEQRERDLQLGRFELDVAKFEQDKLQFGLEYALEQQKLAAAQAGGGELTSKQISQALQMSNSLKSHPAYTDMLDIQTGLQGVMTGLSAKNGFGDITAINAFQRMVDPGATVRSEDVVLLQTGSGLVDKILSDYPIEKLKEGDKLPQAVRDRMKQVALELYERRSGNYNQSVGNQYKLLSEAAGLPFELIGQDFIDAKNLGFEISQSQISPENQQSMEDDYNNQIIETEPAGGGVKEFLKGAWNFFTTPWMPKF